jgi:hypothetical protein
MIAPPHFKCECVTLDKVLGVEKLDKALEIIEKVIKEKQGDFKLLNRPQIIGAKDDKDIDDIMAKINEERGSGDEDGSESNEEGIDIDLGEDDFQEERKEGEVKSKKAQKKKDSDEEDDDEDI